VQRAYAKAVVTCRVDLQRYLETLGPGGTGKGTYTRLLMAMVGDGGDTPCAPFQCPEGVEAPLDATHRSSSLGLPKDQTISPFPLLLLSVWRHSSREGRYARGSLGEARQRTMAFSLIMRGWIHEARAVL
jgi:hypothetical protein